MFNNKIMEETKPEEQSVPEGQNVQQKRELLAPFPKKEAIEKPFDISRISPEVLTSLQIPPSDTIDVQQAQYLITQINYLNDLINEADSDIQQGLSSNINRKKALAEIKALKTQYQTLYPPKSQMIQTEEEQKKKLEEAAYEQMLINAGENPNVPKQVMQEIQNPEDYAKMMEAARKEVPQEIQNPEDYAKMMEEARKKENTILNPNDTLKPATNNILGQTEEQRKEQMQQSLLDIKNQRRYSILAKASYDTHYTNIKQAQDNLQVFLPAHKLINEFTDDESSVFIKDLPDGSQEVILSIRGTDPVSVTDLYTDSLLASGIPIDNTDRYTNAENKLKQIRKAYPNSKIILTGHSLGGTIVSILSKKYDLEGHAFNIGSTPLDLLSGFPDGNNNLNVYHINGDPISISHSLGSNDRVISIPLNTYTDYFSSFFGHDLANFLPQTVMEYELNNPTTKWLLQEKGIKFTPPILANTFRPIKPINEVTPEKPVYKSKKKCKVYIYDKNGNKVCLDDIGQR